MQDLVQETDLEEAGLIRARSESRSITTRASFLGHARRYMAPSFGNAGDVARPQAHALCPS
jgi:hypothetical protein